MHYLCGTCGPCQMIWSILRPVFSPILTDLLVYKSLMRCLDCPNWRFSCRWGQQTYKPIALPLVHARVVIILLYHKKMPSYCWVIFSPRPQLGPFTWGLMLIPSSLELWHPAHQYEGNGSNIFFLAFSRLSWGYSHIPLPSCSESWFLVYWGERRMLPFH